MLSVLLHIVHFYFWHMSKTLEKIVIGAAIKITVVVDVFTKNYLNYTKIVYITAQYFLPVKQKYFTHFQLAQMDEMQVDTGLSLHLPVIYSY